MLFLLTLYYLSSAAAVPVPAVYETTSSNTHPTRTLIGIIWSCLATIFACTWLSIHPNIPEPVEERDTRFWSKCKRTIRSVTSKKLPIFLTALVVPEYVLAWAIRQRLVAGEIAKAGRKKGWTRTHGFFLLMGGYHAYERVEAQDNAETSTNVIRRVIRNKEKDFRSTFEPQHIPDYHDPGRPCYPLDADTALWALKENKIELPSEEEIQDKSKTDWLAKTIVLVQTIWFIAQCIARAVQHLPVTELEIVTLAYTTLSFIIYLAWWDKPWNVTRPVRVYLDEEDKGRDQNEIYSAVSNGEKSIGDRFWKISNFIVGLQDEEVNFKKFKSVPAFYSGEPTRNQFYFSNGITLLFAIVFGAVHLIAWSFEFPTPTERLLWRLSAVAIAGVPVLLSALSVIWPISERLDQIETYNSLISFALLFLYQFLSVIFFASILLGGLLYAVARIITLVLAFMELRSLPAGAYQAVYWSTLIPHI